MKKHMELRELGMFLACLVILSVTYFQSQRQPAYFNWDMIPYIGLAQHWSGKSIPDAHQETFRLIKSKVTDNQFQALTSGGAYHEGVYKNPVFLQNQFPFYAVKPAYPIMLILLDNLGVDMVTASVGISVISYFLIALLLLYWLSRHVPITFAVISIAALVSTPVLSNLARFSTPDALSVFVVLLALLHIIELRRPLIGWLLMLFAVTVRPDNVILLTLFALWSLYYNPVSRRFVLIILPLAILMYFTQKYFSGNYSWPVFFYHAFVEQMLDPSAQDVTLPLRQYFDLYVLLTEPRFSHYLWFAFSLNIVLASLYIKRFTLNNIWSGLLVSNLIYMPIHWLAHPIQKDRTLVLAFIIVFCGFFSIMSEISKTESSSKGSVPD